MKNGYSFFQDWGFPVVLYFPNILSFKSIRNSLITVVSK